MIKKRASISPEYSELERDRAIEVYKNLIRRRAIDKEHPIASALFFAPLTRWGTKMEARKLMLNSDLAPKETYKALFSEFRAPFNSNIDRRLEDLIEKRSSFTNRGDKIHASQAELELGNYRVVSEWNKRNPQTAYAMGLHTEPSDRILKARGLAYMSEQQGLNNLKSFTPFLAFSDTADNSLQRVTGFKPTEKETKEIQEDIRYPVSVLGAGAVGMGAGMYLQNTIKPDNAEKAEALSNKLIEHFNKKGVTPKFREADNPLNSHFNMMSKPQEVYSSKLAPEILAHEYGHASNNAQYKKVFGKKGGTAFHAMTLPLENLTRGVGLGPLMKIPALGLATTPLMFSSVTNKMKTHTGGRWDRAMDVIDEHPEYIAAAAVTPLLAEEGAASFKAWKAIKEVTPVAEHTTAFRSTLKKLGPAYATYLAAASIPVFGAKAYGIHKKRAKALKDEEN